MMLCLSYDDLHLIKLHVLCKTFSRTPSHNNRGGKKMRYCLNVLVQVFQEADTKIGLIVQEIDYGSHPPGKREKGQWRMGEPSDHDAGLTTTEEGRKD